jgi:rhodanese-related sulfurtransferase
MTESVARISKDELAAQLDADDLQVIDVRRDWQHSQQKIKTAVYRDPKAVADWAGRLGTGKRVVLYCSSPREETSEAVARQLLQAGRTDVRVLRGGWYVWRDAGFPVQRKEKEPVPDRFVGGVLSD